MILTSLCFMLSSAWCYAMLTKRRFENFVFPALAADIIVLYLFAIFNCLKAGFYTVIVLKTTLLLGTIIWFSFNRKNFLDNFKNQCVTPGLIFLIVGIIVAFWLPTGQIFSSWDEFSWWGRCLKSICTNDALPLVSGDIKSRYLNYPPATQLCGYLFFKFTGNDYNETLCYCATNLTAVSVFSTYYTTTKWKDWSSNILLGIALFVLPFYFFRNFYTAIYVDTILGLVFGTVCFLQIKPKYEWIDAVILLFVCSFLLLIKRSAASLVAFALIFFIGTAIKNLTKIFKEKNNRIDCLKNIFLCVIPFFSYIISFSWNCTFEHYKCTTSGAFEVNRITGSKIFDALFYNFPSHSDEIVNAFIKAFLETPTYQFATFKISVIGLGITFFILAFLGAVFINNKNQKNKIFSFSIILFVCFITYAISLMLLYIFIFTPFEGKNLASFDRYMTTYLIGIGVFMIGVIANSDNKKLTNLILSVFLFFVPDLYLWSYNNRNKTPIKRRSSNEILNQMLHSVEKKSRIICMNQGSQGFEDRVFRYDYPSNYNGIFSIGKTENKKDIWRLNYSNKQLLQILKNSDYCYIMHKDDILVNQYKDIFEDINSVQDNRIFKLKNDKLVQIPIKKFIFDFEKVSFLRNQKMVKGKTFYDRVNGGQHVRMLPKGVAEFSTVKLNFNQSVKSITVKCEFVRGDAELRITCNQLNLAKFSAQELREGAVTYNCGQNIDMDKVKFVFTNTSNGNTHMLVKNVEFNFNENFWNKSDVVTKPAVAKKPIVTTKSNVVAKPAVAAKPAVIAKPTVKAAVKPSPVTTPVTNKSVTVAKPAVATKPAINKPATVANPTVIAKPASK